MFITSVDRAIVISEEVLSLAAFAAFPFPFALIPCGIEAHRPLAIPGIRLSRSPVSLHSSPRCDRGNCSNGSTGNTGTARLASSVDFP